MAADRDEEQRSALAVGRDVSAETFGKCLKQLHRAFPRKRPLVLPMSSASVVRQHQ